VNQWELVATVLGAGLIPCLLVCALASIADGLIALEVASTLLSTIMIALSEGLQRQPFIDLALTFALLSLLGALAFARLLERDL
jgi:multisubunit Na+/H+ antiporter MnhF subunit